MSHPFETMLEAHLEDKKATISSIGVCYCMLIAARPRLEKPDWSRVNNKIRDTFPPMTDQAWIKKLDKIKQAGWRLHEAVCAKSP